MSEPDPGMGSRVNRPAEIGSAGEPATRGLAPRRLGKALLVALLLGATAFLALRSSSHVQFVPWMPRWLGEWADRNGILRNVVAFFGLGIAWFVLAGRNRWHVLGLTGVAASLEVAQRWIPGRFFDWRDILASLAGVFLAWILIALLAWRARRHFPRPPGCPRRPDQF